jgi:hypothetical protein
MSDGFIVARHDISRFVDESFDGSANKVGADDLDVEKNCETGFVAEADVPIARIGAER